MRYAIVFKALFKRNWLMMRRYPLNLAFSLLTLYLIFLIIFYGAKTLGGGSAALGETLSGIVVGFLLWVLVLSTFNDLAWDLTREAQEGTLEQLYMSPLGFGWVAISHLLSSLILTLGVLAFLLLFMMASSGRWLHIDLISLIPLLLLTLAGIYGLGFAMAGLALVFKQVQAALQAFQFVWVILIAAPLDKFPFLKYLPLSWGTSLIGRVMIQGESIIQIPWSDLLFLTANSAVYCALGFAAFKRLERVAKERGLLGHY